MTQTITPEALERAYQAAKKEWCGLHGSDGQALRAAILAALPELQAAPAAAGVPVYATNTGRQDDDGNELYTLTDAQFPLSEYFLLHEAQPQAEPWGWSVVGTRHVFFGEHARDDAEREARHCGGSARALPLYTAPPAAVDLEALSVLIAHAEGKIQHHNNGLCPDRLEGHDIRDPACTVCNALIDSKAVRNG